MASGNSLRLRVNGVERRVRSAADRPLLGVLRDEFDLCGTKYGCGEAQCGACTVLQDDRAIRACITEVGSVAGKTITTIEGVAHGERLHALQQAFIDADALQCGYCTSGMILSALALLRRKSDPTEDEIASALQGNVCRCGTYPRILVAIRAAAAALKKSGQRP